jgi:hypothetical protein
VKFLQPAGRTKNSTKARTLARIESTPSIQSLRLHEFYDRLRVIKTSGPLLSRDRLRTIVAMNAGKYDRPALRISARRLLSHVLAFI